METGPLLQRGYLWQRNWTPAVAAAYVEADEKMDGLVVLGAEIVWKNSIPQVIRASVPWQLLKNSTKPCSIALRIAPFPGPFQTGDASTRYIVESAQSLLAEAKANGVAIGELQIDFDCGQKKLGGYRLWLQALRSAIQPQRLVITTLPSWLDESDFLPLVREADGYVLQVHSVPTSKESGHAVLCDPELAKQWVSKASRLGLPFSVALPTYRCLAGYGADGKLLGVMMDSVPLAWPEGTYVLEFGVNEDEMAELVQEWRTNPPAGLKGVLWYRIPVATDELNWTWATLSAVMAGRKPLHRLAAVQEGSNPIDLSIVNDGEGDEPQDAAVTATWINARLIASDALDGWTVEIEPGRAVFRPEPGFHPRLSPGERRSIGWLRYDGAPTLQVEVAAPASMSHH